jgi:hypothetical protein
VVAAGDIIEAADVNEREATTPLVADSATWTNSPEVVAASVTIAAVAGQKYKLWFSGRISTDVAGDAANMRIREDSVSGNQVQLGQVYLPTTTGNGWSTYLYAEWTAAASGSKTFVVTGQRSLGTGVAHRIRATSNSPGFFVAEKVIGS